MSTAIAAAGGPPLAPRPFDGLGAEALPACAEPSLNGLMSLGRQAWFALRRGLSECLREGSLRATELGTALVPQGEAQFTLTARQHPQLHGCASAADQLF